MLLRRHFVAGADARHCRGSGLGYDPRGRLFQISTSSTSRFLYDGTDIIAEYSGAGTLLRRYVHGTGHDEPIVWYEGAGTNDRRSLVADERGSIVAVTNSTGALLAINTYDAFGQPGAAISAASSSRARSGWPNSASTTIRPAPTPPHSGASFSQIPSGTMAA